MIIDEFIVTPKRPFSLNGFNATKSVLNFLCDHLLNPDLVITYAPHREFGVLTSHTWLLGGWVCDYDTETAELTTRITANYRIIYTLYEAGYIQAHFDIKVPAKNIVTFRWSKEAINSVRKIALTHIINRRAPGRFTIMPLAALYGVKLKYYKSKGLFEVVKPDDTPIKKGNYKRSIVFANSEGEPVTRFSDMSCLEWEKFLYLAAKRGGTLNNPVPIKQVNVVHQSHFSAFKRA